MYKRQQQGDAGRAHGEQAGQTFGIVTVVVQLGAGDDGEAALQPVCMQTGQDEAGALGGQQDVGPAQEGSLGRQQTQLDGPAGGTGTQAVGDVVVGSGKEDVYKRQAMTKPPRRISTLP